MRNCLALLTAAALLLSLCGCQSLSQRNARMEDLALIQVLAADGDDTEVQVSLADLPTQGQEGVALTGSGITVGGACADARGKGSSYPTLTHVEHLLVGEGLAKEGLGPLLDHLERDVELRLSARLWLVRGTTEGLLTGGGGAAKRLSALGELAGEAGAGYLPTAGELVSALDRSGAGLLPALAPDGAGSLDFAGYGIIDGGKLTGWLEGDCARGADLLLGRAADSVVEFCLPDGSAGTVQLGQSDCRVTGLFEEGEITALRVRCHLRGTVEQLDGDLDPEVAERALCQWAEDCIRQCAAMLQSMESDPLELGRKVGAAAPWRWDAVAARWGEVFPRLDMEVEVTAEVSR